MHIERDQPREASPLGSHMRSFNMHTFLQCEAIRSRCLMRRLRCTGLVWFFLLSGVALPQLLLGADAVAAPGSKLPAPDGNKVITAADVTAERTGASIPVSAIGEPVSAVNLSAPR